MKKLRVVVTKIINSISLVDKFLMLFMAILFIYMTVRLLTGSAASQGTDSVDIIIRTSAAAIFGYFISSNFVKPSPMSTTNSTAGSELVIPSETLKESGGDGVVNQIGFQIPSDSQSQELGGITVSEPQTTPVGNCSKTQVYVVSIIGLFSLAILLIARNCHGETSEITAIISQLRDFISACIGFLVSCGKNTIS